VDDAFSSLLLVGHNPGMHHISLLLSDPRRTELRKTLEIKYPTCALAVISFEQKHWDKLAPSEGKLIDFMTPEDL
jgi:phosphohistidine phosphatase